MLFSELVIAQIFITLIVQIIAEHFFGPTMRIIFPVFYSFTIIWLTQVILYEMPEEIKKKVSGTWSSMMSSENIYGSKFLLFSTAVLSISLINLEINFYQKLIQTAFILIGFFPSNLHLHDDFLLDFLPNNVSFTRKLISTIIHITSSLSYGVVMFVLNIKIMKNYLFLIPYLLPGISFILFQAIWFFKPTIFNNNIINHLSVFCETSFLFVGIVLSLLSY